MTGFKLGLFLASGIALSAALGCDAQVGDDYTGETILSLRGNVQLRDVDTDMDVRPALVFFSLEGFQVVDGETTGEFPSRFRFDVSQPPPEAAYLPTEPRDHINGKLAIGYIAMLPAEHPSALATTSTDLVCNDDYTMCNYVNTSCDDAGSCRTRTFECVQRACEPIGEVGEPLDLRDATTGSNEIWCSGDTCYTIDSECSSEGNCYAAFHECERTMGDWIYADGTMDDCELVDESGDTGIVASDDLDAVAANYFVAYVSEDSPEADGGALKAGYNLFEILEPSRDEWMAYQTCSLEVRREVVTEYNAEHGSDWDLFVWSDENEDLYNLIEDVTEEECGPLTRYQRVDSSADAELTIELGSAPSL